MKIVIIGNRASVAEPGNLASAILDYVADNEPEVTVIATDSPEYADVVIYCRSVNDGFVEVVDFCDQNATPLLVLSTGFDMGELDTASFKYLTASNSNADVADYVELLRSDVESLKDVAEFHLEEHHQTIKKDVSGTAIMICNELGLNKEQIVSVRDIDKTNQTFDLDLKDGDLYAIHRFWAKDSKGFKTPTRDIVVTDHSGYARGAMRLCRQLISD